MPKLAIVQLARRGDLVSVLPVAWHYHTQGWEVDVYAHEDFVDALEPCSYVTPRPVPTTHRAVNATADAVRGRYDLVLETQVDANRRPPPAKFPNFIQEQWGRAGLAERFHDLPLVFDRRDAEGERQALAQHWPDAGGLPVLLLCLKGHSSPFVANYGKSDDSAAVFEDWLRRALCKRWQVLGIGGLQLRKAHHLLAFLERADALVSIDTLPIHLAYATGTPTFVLSREVPWYQSEPRAHWCGRWTYPEANTDACRVPLLDMIDRRDFAPGRLCRPVVGERVESVYHVVDWWTPPDGHPDRGRILAAKASWDRLAEADGAWSTVLHDTDRDARRTSRDIGDNRKLPYIRDLIDFGCDAAERAGDPDGIVVFTNSDVGVVPEAAEAVRYALRDAPCAFSRRIDVRGGRAYTRADLARHKAHVGADLFAFRASWWRRNGSSFPDMIYAAEGWDALARWRCWAANPAAEIAPCIVWHIDHAPFWSMNQNIHTCESQRHNRAEARRWAAENGLGMALWPDGARWLCRIDEQWMGAAGITPADLCRLARKPEPAMT